MPHQYETELDVVVSDEIATGCFTVTEETYPAEPYSWGQSRGVETDITIRLDELAFGIFNFDRTAAIAAFGHGEIADVEAFAFEEFCLCA